MNKSGIVGLCMLTSAFSGFTTGYYFSDIASLLSKNAVVKAEAKPNRLINGLAGGLCALLAGTSTAVVLNRHYGEEFEELQNSY